MPTIKGLIYEGRRGRTPIRSQAMGVVAACFAMVLSEASSAQAGWRWIQANACVNAPGFYNTATDSVIQPAAYYAGQYVNVVNSYIFMVTNIEHYWTSFNLPTSQWAAQQSQSYTIQSPTNGEFGANNGCNCPSWLYGLPKYYLNRSSGRVQSVSWDYGTYAGGPASFSRAMRHQELVGGAWVTIGTYPIVTEDINGALFHSALNGNLYRPLSNGSFLVWDGNSSWTTLQPLVVPPSVAASDMVHDVGRERLVMPVVGSGQATLWEYDIAQNFWYERIGMIPSNFGNRTAYSLCYHPPTQNVVLYGGRNGAGVLMGDIWHYNGQSFYQALVGVMPARRESAHMVYRAATQEVLMWGGSNGQGLGDTWGYVPGVATVAYQTYGTGCPGAAGQSTINAAFNSLPYSGQTFLANVTNVPFFAPVFMAVGFSDAQWNGAQLPLSMSPFGMPGCNVRASVDIVMPLTNVLGVAVWSVNIPPGLGGSVFYNQAITFEPAVNPAGLTLSNAVRATVGY
jgi:hypothetical protein